MWTHSGASSAEALWHDANGSALAKSWRMRYGETPAEAQSRVVYGGGMAHHLRNRYIATLAEAIWRNACGALWQDAGGSALARRRRNHSGTTTAEAL